MTLTIEEYTNTLFQEMIRIFLMILTYFLGIFGYDFPHYKTNEIIKDTFLNGFSIGAVLLAPKINYTNNINVTSIDKDCRNKEIREFCKSK